MIDYENQKLVRGDLMEDITKWEVAFQTPVGLAETLPQAVEACQRIDVDPNIAVVPVAVAITKSTYEVVHR